jgi:hypothetical protein
MGLPLGCGVADNLAELVPTACPPLAAGRHGVCRMAGRGGESMPDKGPGSKGGGKKPKGGKAAGKGAGTKKK